MTTELKLLWAADVNASPADEVDLYNFADGIALADDGYRPGVPSPGQAWVTDALTLIIRGADDDELADNFSALDKILLKLKRTTDGHERYRLWLSVRLKNETNERWYMVRNYAQGPIPIWKGESRRASGGYYYVTDYVLSLERAAMGEGQQSAGAGTSVSCVGGLEALTVVGDGVATGRLLSVSFLGVNGGGGPLYKFWMGLRGDRNGTPANFAPNWHCKDGTLSFSTGTTSDVTAKSGTRTACSFGSTAMLARVTIRADQATASVDDQRGRFLVLLRSKVSDAGVVCRVRLLDGLASSSAFRTQDRVKIESTSWMYYELGTVQIPTPGGDYSATSDTIDKYALRIEAERTATAGSGELHMDCLTLIPIDEGFIYAEGGAVEYSSGDERPLVVSVRPNGVADSVWLSSNFPQAWGVPKVTGGMPESAAGVYAVLAGQRSTASVLADVVDLDFEVALRYPTLRGDDQ